MARYKKLPPVQYAELIDHEKICELAKTSPFTAYFVSHPFFTNDWQGMYKRKEVGVLREKDELLGFVYVKHLLKRPYSKLHFMTVHPSARHRGIGAMLIAWARSITPHVHMRLMCETNNVEALAFYRAQGGKELGLHVTRSGYEMMQFEYTSTNPIVRPHPRFFE